MLRRRVPVLLSCSLLIALLPTALAAAPAAAPTAPDAGLVERARRVGADAARRSTGADAVPVGVVTAWRDAPEGVRDLQGVEEVTIPTADGLALPAWFVPRQTPGTPKGTVVVLHGWTSDVGFALQQARFLLDAGYQLLLPGARVNTFVGRDAEYRGFLREDVDDTLAAVAWVRARPGVDPARVALYGFSWGGAKAVLAGARAPEGHVRAVIDDAGPLLGDVLRPRFREHMPPVVRDDAALFAVFEEAFAAALRERLGYGPDAVDLLAAAKVLAPRPLLVLHGEDDEVVPIETARRVHAAAGEPKVLVTHPKFGHCLGMRAAPDAYVPAVLRFLDEHLAR